MSLLTINNFEVILEGGVTPIEFWPYPAVVTGSILKIAYKSFDPFHQLQKELVVIFNAAGIKCQEDNKIAFAIKDEDGRTFCLGFKDWVFTLGTGVRKI